MTWYPIIASYDNVEKGSIILKRSPTFTFHKDGVLLCDDSVEPSESIKSDLVIFATGFKGDQKLRDIFASIKFQKYLTNPINDTVPLYRECIHPHIPQLAVLGFSESFANLYTSEINCRWLFELLDGKFKLPNIQEMEKELSIWNKSMKLYSSKYYGVRKAMHRSVAYLLKQFFPDQSQVFDYLQSYANHFDLLKHIRFNTKVVSIKYEGPSDEEIQSWALWGGNNDPFGNLGKWVVTTQDLLNQTIEVMQVDFVILCLGRFSDLPNIPEFPSDKGPEVFNGKVMHSMDYSALDYESARNLIKGKQITVVGFQKSALDIAMECSIANGVEKPCTVICRTPHWNVPDYFPWGFPLAYLYLNRFSELLVHKPGEGLLLSLIASLLLPLRWSISKFVESDIKKKHRLEKFDMGTQKSRVSRREKGETFGTKLEGAWWPGEQFWGLVGFVGRGSGWKWLVGEWGGPAGGGYGWIGVAEGERDRDGCQG
uniref:Flavin-containing monooxygenase n=1 Tax=Chenopodium quinoa TaxID=63459 RepID=A0A803MCE1_CHEQI